MELKYSDNVKLVVNITEEMKQDYRECGECACVPGGDGKDCVMLAGINYESRIERLLRAGGRGRDE